MSYCLDAKKAIEELARVAKPKAFVTISVDNEYAMISRIIAEGSLEELNSFIKNRNFNKRL